MKKSNLYLLLLILLTGCILRKDEYDPTFSFAEEYTGQTKIAVDNQQSLSNWWEQFHDPLLSELISEVDTGNFDVRIALERINEIRAKYKIEFGKLWPEIDLEGYWSRSRRSATLFAEEFQGPLYQNVYEFGFDAFWEIDLFGKRRFAKDAAYFDYLASIENARFVTITTIAELAKLYIDIRALQERIALLYNYIASQAEQIRLANNRFRSGLTPQFELLENQAKIDAKKAELPLLEAALQQTIYALSVLLGKEPNALTAKLSEKQALPIAEGRVPLGMPSDLLRRRPDVRRALEELFASKARISVSKRELFPSVALTSAFAYKTQFLHEWFTWPSRTWTIGPALFMPLFKGGQLWANIEAHNSKEKQVALNYEKTVYIAFKEVEDALTGYFEESRRVEALTDEHASVKRVLHLSGDLFESGLQSLTPVIDSELSLFQIDEQLIMSRQELMTQLIALYKALGGGWTCSDTP
jgi:outer membrane protein, multidrug efflux system